MPSFASLWLPTILSALAVFVASSVIHMLSPWHRKDYPKLRAQDDVMAALRPFALPPGDYMLPRPESVEEMKSAAFVERMRQGPVVMMTVFPNGPVTMGRNLGLWMVYILVVNGVSGCLAALASGTEAHFHSLMHYTLVTSFLGYVAGLWQMSIWYRRGWVLTLRATFDGLIYALITGYVFATFLQGGATG